MSLLKFQNTLLLALLAALFLVACDQEANDDLTDDVDLNAELELRDDVEEPHGGPNGALGRPGCLRLLFPLTVDLPDGTSTEVADRQELRELLRAWKASNPGSTERPRIAFPHDIELPDGTVVTVSTPRQLRNFVRRCQGKPVGFRPRPCFQLVFPITVAFPDGSTFEAADRQALAEFARIWRETHPDFDGHPEFVKPYQVLLRDGNLATISEDGDLEDIVADCRDERPGPQPELCFQLVYPVTLVFPNGETATADSRPEMALLIEAWRRTNPGSAQRPALVFPIEIELDGEVVEVEDAETLEEIIGDCWEDRPYDLPCFRLDFPVGIILPDGSTKMVDNRYQLARHLWLWGKKRPAAGRNTGLAYPVNIIYEDGTNATVNSPAEWRNVLETCRN